MPSERSGNGSDDHKGARGRASRSVRLGKTKQAMKRILLFLEQISTACCLIFVSIEYSINRCSVETICYWRYCLCLSVTLIQL